MKNSIYVALLALSIFATLSACNNSTPKNSPVTSEVAKKEIYTCPMHPEVQSDKPGKCPKCGMELVKKKPADSTHMRNQSDTMHGK